MLTNQLNYLGTTTLEIPPTPWEPGPNNTTKKCMHKSNNIVPSRGGSRISGKGVRTYKGRGGVRYVDVIIFLTIRENKIIIIIIIL